MLATRETRRTARPLRQTIRPTGVERRFRDSDIIVTKTDPKGRITYANDIFLAVSGFREEEVIGQPHSLVRHPDMPRCVFQLLWETIQKGEELFALVVNLCKNGDHYWVLAHVTPTADGSGKVLGYHSNRRTAPRAAVDAITSLYAELRGIEHGHEDRRRGLEASRARLDSFLREKGVSFNEYVLTLARN